MIDLTPIYIPELLLRADQTDVINRLKSFGFPVIPITRGSDEDIHQPTTFTHRLRANELAEFDENLLIFLLIEGPWRTIVTKKWLREIANDVYQIDFIYGEQDLPYKVQGASNKYHFRGTDIIFPELENISPLLACNTDSKSKIPYNPGLYVITESPKSVVPLYIGRGKSLRDRLSNKHDTIDRLLEIHSKLAIRLIPFNKNLMDGIFHSHLDTLENAARQYYGCMFHRNGFGMELYIHLHKVMMCPKKTRITATF